MSAEKERRYQELYKNRFVNPIDQGIGRRTGWVLNKEVRKDSEGFELFDDYWSDSGEESVDDLSLHANKENKGRPYKLSSPIKLMPDYTPSSRASTDVEPLSDVGSKTVTSNSTLTKDSNDSSKSDQAGQARTNEKPLERENGTTSEDNEALVEVTTPGREDGGIQESDITGSIMKGGSSFQAPNSALHEFKTKTRLSFGNDVDDTPKRQSTQRTSARTLSNHSDGESATSDTTLKGSQSDVDSESCGTRQDKTSTEEEMLAVETEPGTTEKTGQSGLDGASDSEPTGKVTSAQVPKKETTTPKDSGAPKQKLAGKSLSKGSGVSVQQSTASEHQGATGTRRQTRRRKNIRPMEEDLTSGDDGMFISLHKSSVSQQNGAVETVADIISDQSFPDAGDDEMLEIVDDDRSYKSTLNSLNTEAKSRAALKRDKRHSVSSTVVESGSKMRKQRGRQKKADKQDVSEDIINLTSDGSVPNSTEEMAEPAGISSEESGVGAQRSKQVQPSKTSRSRKSTARSSSRKAVPSSSDVEAESGTTGSDMNVSKKTQSRRRQTRTSKKSLSSDADGTGSAKATEVVVEDKVGLNDTKTSRRRNRSVRGQSSTDSKTDEEPGPNADANKTEKSTHEGAHSNTDQDQVAFKQPPAASSRKSAQKKRSSVHFSNVHVDIISDEALLPTVENEPVEGENTIKPLPSEDIFDIAPDNSSPRKKFKGTPEVKPVQRGSTNKGSKGGEEIPDKMPQKRTSENEEEATRPKRQRGSSVVRGGRKRAGKRKLYSGDLPSSFLNDPSLNDATSAASTTNANATTAEDGSSSVRDQQRNQPQQEGPVAPSQGRARGKGRGREQKKGRGTTRGRGSVKKTQPTKEAPIKDTQAPDDIVLNFLTSYESGKESESTDSSDGPTIMESPQPDMNATDSSDGPTIMESPQPDMNATDSSDGPTIMESPQPDMNATGSTTVPAGMYTTVYPEPTPQSILKKPTSAGVDARKKNLTLQFFEVPKQKPIIVPPDDTEDGPRRTRRNRVRPVEYWRNERAEYQRRKSGGFVLVGIQSPQGSSPELHTQQQQKKTKGPKKLMQTPSNLSMHVSPPPGSKVADHPALVVMNPDTQQEVEVDTLRTAKMNVFVGPSGKEAMPDDPITLCKAITQKAFSSGILTIRPLSEKGLQFVRNDTMVFYITRGKVSVTIHHTTSILQNGDMFFVPQGNMYNIKNLRRDEAKLVFFQHKGH